MLRHPITLLLVSLVLLGAVWFVYPTLVPPPPLPEDKASIEPELRTAIDDAAAAVRRRFHSTSSLKDLGLLYQAHGMDALALACYEAAVEGGSSDASLWFFIARMRDELGDTDGAIAALQEAARHNDDYAPIRWRLGGLLFDAGRLDEARSAFEAATRIDDADPAGWAGRALVHLSMNETERAIDIAEDRLKKLGAASFANHVLAITARRQGDLAASRAHAAVATPDPDWYDPWSSDVAARRIVGSLSKRKYAVEHVAAGRFHKAVPILEELLREDTDDAKLLSDLGIACIETGKPDKGRDMLERAAEIAPDNPTVLGNYATALLRTAGPGIDDLLEALRQCDRAIEASPAPGKYHALRGDVLSQLDRAADAIRAYDDAFEADSRSASPLLRAGRLHVERGDIGQAVATLERAVEAFPTDFDSLVALATALALADRVDEARTTLQRAEPQTRQQQKTRREVFGFIDSR